MEREHTVAPVEQLHWDGKTYKIGGGTHGAAHGIQLKHGKYKGRLLCASRTGIGSYTDWNGLQKVTYNNAIYSDDHGKTWKTANCVQVGTGEGTLIENADGTLTYNSRAYFKDGKRRIATSTDGGATWGNFRNDDFLEEEAFCGCNASFLRVALEDIKDKSILPEGAKDVTVFCNPRAKTRDNMCACVSFDSGNTWSKVKVINPGHAAYSSLEWNPVTQKFCLLYETGEKHPYSDGITAAEFDMEWLLSE
ncbi:MAG: exo-alpha-sialidase [Ruminococcaceae bacterium]|nr:exo-alpha-sialidase [Oscillospiraceae bacterium]